MSIIEDLITEVENYPATGVELEIVDVTVPGAALNVGEQATFRVRVTNTGALNLTGVTLRVHGQNGATVANNGAAAPFVSQFVTQELAPIEGNGGSQLTVGSKLKFKAPSTAQAPAILVKATLETWDSNFNDIMIIDSGPLDQPTGTHTARVLAS